MHDGRIRTCIETEFEVTGHRATGKIKNVSESGVFVGTASIPEQGEDVDLNFKTPDGKEVRLSGLVWWTTDDCGGTRHRVPGFGLRLLDNNEEFRRFLASLRRRSGMKRRKF
jgi:Tfp pilus assembly protein PilZ